MPLCFQMDGTMRLQHCSSSPIWRGCPACDPVGSGAPASLQIIVGLVDALTTHYRRQFEKTTWTAGEDPSIFAIALGTLAVKAFGDMGQTARLRLIREIFIAGRNSCELRRHLDSVSPETPMLGMGESCGLGVRRISKPGSDTVFPLCS